jgi:DNA-binding NarL/FixJ family response regulator
LSTDRSHRDSENDQDDDGQCDSDPGELLTRGTHSVGYLLKERVGDVTEGRTDQAIAAALSLNARTVESHVRSIFTKLGLEPEPDDHRQVLAVITFLRAGGST